MTTGRTVQHRFTQGELDPRMMGRTDIDQYYGAAEAMKNIVGLPQGGWRRRPGLETIQRELKQLTFLTGGAVTISAPNGGTTANSNDQNTATAFTTTTNIGVLNPYVIIQHDYGASIPLGTAYIYGLALTAGASNQVYLQGSNDNISFTTLGAAMSVSTVAKTFTRRIQASYRYLRVARIGATDLTTSKFTLTDFNVFSEAVNSNSRHIAFEFSSDQSYEILATDKTLTVYKDGVYQLDIYAPNITHARLPDIMWTQSADTLLIFHEDFPTIKVQRQGADDVWSFGDLAFDFTPFYAFTETVQTAAAYGLTGTITPSAVSGTVKLTATGGTWPVGSPNQYVEMNGGRARILSIVSATVVNAYVEIPFYNLDATAVASVSVITGYEAVWSVTRGYPICGTFHAGRLWIGGSKARPTTLWGSRVGLYFDFDPGTSLDDEGIQFTLDTDQLNRITNVYSGRNLMIFTTGAEFIVPSNMNDPITPSNISTLRQSSNGSKRGLRVVETEGGIFYLQNGGRSIQEFLYDAGQDAYANNLISILSGHLVANPVDFTLRRATSLDEGALLVLTRSDGKATIATILRSQGITSFTDQTTDGLFLQCGVDYNDVYFTVERTTNGQTHRWLERFNDDHLLDASTRFTTGLPTATFTGMTQNEGVECRVFADGSVMTRRTPASGSVTIERNATTACEIGRWFQPYFKDLPVEIPSLGTVFGKKMSISEVILRLYQTTNCKINGKTQSFRGFGPAGGGSPLDAPPPAYTGIKRILGFLGWTYTAQVEITQDEPGALTVLELSKRVTFDG